MKKTVVISFLLAVFFSISSLVTLSCNQAEDKAKQTIMDNLPSMVMPISEFQFTGESEDGVMTFTFKSSNGSIYEGTYNGTYVNFRLVE